MASRHARAPRRLLIAVRILRTLHVPPSRHAADTERVDELDQNSQASPQAGPNGRIVDCGHNSEDAPRRPINTRQKTATGQPRYARLTASTDSRPECAGRSRRQPHFGEARQIPPARPCAVEAVQPHEAIQSISRKRHTTTSQRPQDNFTTIMQQHLHIIPATEPSTKSQANITTAMQQLLHINPTTKPSNKPHGSISIKHCTISLSTQPYTILSIKHQDNL